MMKLQQTVYVFALLAMITLTLIFMGHKSEVAGASLKQTLLDQLKSTHTRKDWFVTTAVATEGLTPAQALWTDKSGNHSVAQLTYHLYFWNKRQAETFKGIKSAEFSGDNEETFTGFDKMSWPTLVANLDKVLTELETIVAGATDAQLEKWAPTLANINTHNAYHTGQMVYVRKLQGVWDAEKGVK